MTISYTLDVSQTSFKSFIKLLFRWRGSVWKAVFSQLFCWTLFFLFISFVYRYCMSDEQMVFFENLVKYLDNKLDSTIPLTFMLGFFVSFVVGRWGSILNGIGWIDDAAILFATYIRGGDDETRILRRNLVRYMVLSQALVLRDISMQVRKRFPTLETLSVSGLMTEEEAIILEEIHDPYSRYWAPIQWAINLVYDSKQSGKIDDYYLLNKIIDEVTKFRHGLAALLKYDWVPVPLVYPQVIFLSVRIYFGICLIGRQFLVPHSGIVHADQHKAVSLTSDGISSMWFPITTMVQFIVYMGWMKVAEALLNPLGEDDDDLECNYIIDKNLITGIHLVDDMWNHSKHRERSLQYSFKTGYSVVEEGLARIPSLKKDDFWGTDKIAPLYSMESAERTVHPLVGSASKINLVKGKKEIIMTPHKNKLSEITPGDQHLYLRKVNVSEHNEKHETMKKSERANSPDTCLQRVRGRSKCQDAIMEDLNTTEFVQYYENGKFTPALRNGSMNEEWTRADIEMNHPPRILYNNNSVAPHQSEYTNTNGTNTTNAENDETLQVPHRF